MSILSRQNALTKAGRGRLHTTSPQSVAVGPALEVDSAKSVAVLGPAPSGSDWLSRIAAPGVVWYHSFESDAEVNQFRFIIYRDSNGTEVSYGLNPSGSMGQRYMYRVAYGGADGGGYMELFRPAGDGMHDSGDGCYWYRMLNPLTGASNGRGVDDPGAPTVSGGAPTIPLQTYTPTEQGTQIYEWSNRVGRSGWYGLPEYEAAGNYGYTGDGDPVAPQVFRDFDGHDFYLQVRVKVDPRRITTGSVIGGKLLNFTTTRSTYTAQELVTNSGWCYPNGTIVSGQPNVHNMYQGMNYASIAQLATPGSIVNETAATRWSYSGGWDTLLYHITPGHDNKDRLVSGPLINDTRIEVWAAHPGETNYTKIWDAYYRGCFDDVGPFAPNEKWGWNAFMCWIYQNWLPTTQDFKQAYDQIIFSKQPIACPSGGAFPQTVTLTTYEADHQPNGYAWQTPWVDHAGRMLMWGTGGHGYTYGLSGDQNVAPVRAFNPLTNQIDKLHYPANDGATLGNPVSNQDNMVYWYIPELESLLIPYYGAYKTSITGTSPYWGWTHGNSAANSGVDGANWPSGPYWSNLVSNYVVTLKNSFAAFCPEQNIGIAISNSAPFSPSNQCAVLYKSGSQWTMKYVTLTGFPSVGHNRNGICVVGSHVYVAGGSALQNGVGTTGFYRIDAQAIADTAANGSTPSSALTVMASLPTPMGGLDARGLDNWCQLTYDPVFHVIVMAGPTGVWLYDVRTNVWSGNRAPVGWDGGWSLVNLVQTQGCGMTQGCYLPRGGGHYYRNSKNGDMPIQKLTLS
jgi:hypothetical protein